MPDLPARGFAVRGFAVLREGGFVLAALPARGFAAGFFPARLPVVVFFSAMVILLEIRW
jgi:hypothetical protein